MTALAMIIGMIPMALGLGEGAEQNAPLGRAVIGGLLFATVSTLFFVPVIFAGTHRRLEQRKERRLSAVPPDAEGIADMSETESTAVLKRAKFIVGAIVSVLLIGAVIVLVLRSFHAGALEASTALHAKRYVTTVMPAAGGEGQPLTPAGNIAGDHRIDGLCTQQRLCRALGEGHRQHGQKGRTPGRDHRARNRPGMSQAVSARDQAAASASLAKSTGDRWQALRQRDAVTQQDLDERLSAYNQAAANLAAADANVGRLRKLQGFNQVMAPFDGVVTRRNVDVGDLVNAGNGGTGQALFAVAQVEPAASVRIRAPGVCASNQDRRCSDRHFG